MNNSGGGGEHIGQWRILGIIVAEVVMVATTMGILNAGMLEDAPDKLAGQIANISSAVYKDFDNKTCSGMEVRNMLDSIKGESTFVLVNTSGVQRALHSKNKLKPIETVDEIDKSRLLTKQEYSLHVGLDGEVYELPLIVLINNNAYIVYNALPDLGGASYSSSNQMVRMSGKEACYMM